MSQHHVQPFCMPRWAVCSLFLVTIVWSCLGLISSTVFQQEPYPALTMPRFRGSGGATATDVSTRRARAVVRYADGHEVNLTQRELLDHLPISNRSDRMRKVFDRTNPVSNRQSAMTGEDEVRLRSQNDAELRQWFGRTVQRHHAAAEPIELRIDWFNDRRRLSDLSGEAHSERIASYVLPLVPEDPDEIR